MSAVTQTAIHFNVPTLPIAQPRQRTRVTKARNGKTFAQNYTPKNDPVNAYKAALQQAATDAYSEAPLDSPLLLVVEFVLPRNKGLMWKKKPMPRMRHTTKPDLDNLLKSTKDALSGVLFRDDKQVCSVQATKWIASGDEQPHVEIRICELDV